MDNEISKLDTETCTLNRIFFRRFVRESLSSSKKGWLSKPELAKLLNLDSVETLEELIKSKHEILESLSQYLNGEDILHLIDDLKFPLCINKGDRWTLFEFFTSSDHSWEAIEANVWRVINTGRKLKFSWEDEEEYIVADNILRYLGLYDVLLESKQHEVLKKLADKVKHTNKKFSVEYDKLLYKLRMMVIHAIYSVLGSLQLTINFFKWVSLLIGKGEPGFDEIIEKYLLIRKSVFKKSEMNEEIKQYDVTKPKVKDQFIEELELYGLDNPRVYIQNKKDKHVFKKIISFKINELLKIKYNSILEKEKVVDMHDS